MTDNYKYIIRSYQSYLSWFLDWCGWCSTSSPKDFDPTKFRESQKWFWHFSTFLKYSEKIKVILSYRCHTRWCPKLCLLVYNPINYRYITNKNHSEIGVICTNLAIYLGGTTLYQRPMSNGRFPGVASPEHQPTSRHFQASAWPCWETGGWPSLGVRATSRKRSPRPMATWEVPSGYVKIAMVNGHRNSGFSH